MKKISHEYAVGWASQSYVTVEPHGNTNRISYQCWFLPHPNLVKSAQTEKRKKLENDTLSSQLKQKSAKSWKMTLLMR
jgi:hypothetical protein